MNAHRDFWRGQPRLRILFAAIIGAMFLKIIARYAWGYRAPNWLDLGLAIALLIVLFTAMRRSREARLG
jgi:hypothetical protein